MNPLEAEQEANRDAPPVGHASCTEPASTSSGTASSNLQSLTRESFHDTAWGPVQRPSFHDELFAQRDDISLQVDDALRALQARTNCFRGLIWLLRRYCVARQERALMWTALQRNMPAEVAGSLVAARGRLNSVLTLATVFFVDIEGSTAIGEALGPKNLVELLNQYFTVVSGPIQTRGGIITQFQGDAILAAFNVPARDRNHARDGVLAALEIQRILSQHTFIDGIRLATRIGVATGEITAGFVGTRKQANYTVHGMAVNLAARLEKQNKRFGTRILACPITAALAGHDVDCRAVDTVRIQGMSQSCTLYEPQEPACEAAPEIAHCPT